MTTSLKDSVSSSITSYFFCGNFRNKGGSGTAMFIVSSTLLCHLTSLRYVAYSPPILVHIHATSISSVTLNHRRHGKYAIFLSYSCTFCCAPRKRRNRPVALTTSKPTWSVKTNSPCSATMPTSTIGSTRSCCHMRKYRPYIGSGILE